jgi:hypothetical protein
MRLKKEGTVSVGAMLLAFLASQHHNVHMALLTLGLGGSGMTFMTVYPGIRRAMLLLSLSIVVVNLRSLLRQPAPPTMRTVVAGFSVLTLGTIVWSLIRFGL